MEMLSFIMSNFHCAAIKLSKAQIRPSKPLAIATRYILLANSFPTRLLLLRAQIIFLRIRRLIFLLLSREEVLEVFRPTRGIVGGEGMPHAAVVLVRMGLMFRVWGCESMAEG